MLTNKVFCFEHGLNGTRVNLTLNKLSLGVSKCTYTLQISLPPEEHALSRAILLSSRPCTFSRFYSDFRNDFRFYVRLVGDRLLFFHHDRVLTVAFCSFQVVFLVVLFVAVVSAQFGDFYGGGVYGPEGISGFAPFAASVRDPRQNTGTGKFH